MALVKYNNNSISAVTALDSIASGSLVLLATNTITSGVASSSFTSGINSTYDTYLFKFINIQPANNDVRFVFNFSTDGGSNYNVTKTTTLFHARHEEDGSYSEFGYVSSRDLAQSTSDQQVSVYTLKNSDPESISGELYLFSPSSTTFVKHFLGVANESGAGSTSVCSPSYYAGYCNTTSAVDAVTFKMDSGNIASGVIKMYGLSKS